MLAATTSTPPPFSEEFGSSWLVPVDVDALGDGDACGDDIHSTARRERETPPSADQTPRVRDVEPVPCDLSSRFTSDEIFVEEKDFTWIIDEDEPTTSRVDEEVRGCPCLLPPSCGPIAFVPCCLPAGVLLATREIQMLEFFRNSLLGLNGAHPKTQTMRRWSPGRVAERKHSFVHGKWIRVWRGQGHRSTIGWLLLTGWDTVKIRDIDRGDCMREGCPQLSPREFVNMFFPLLKPTDRLQRLQFVFRACHTDR
jgi:hypothetical protein